MTIRYDQWMKHIPPSCNGDFNDSVEKKLQLSTKIEAIIVFYICRGLDKMSCIYAYVISTSGIIGSKF